MTTEYVFDLGSGNAGESPTFSVFKNADTGVDVTPPAITEDGGGMFRFAWDWTTSAATSIQYKTADLNGVSVSDVIASNVALQGSAAATAAASSVVGYSTAGVLVARAAVQCGILGLTRAQVATYDPFSAADPNIFQMLELLDSLGMELAAQVKIHLQREFTITTAGAALSYTLPADYVEMVDDTLWNNSGVYPLSGPITATEERYIVAWNGLNTVRIPYRVLGNRITFPSDPGDGLSITGLYVSRYWVQTAAASAPDADHAGTATDYVLFDPTLVVLGLKLKFKQEKGEDTAGALAEFQQRLEWAKGVAGGARVLSLNGSEGSWFRFLDSSNLPVRLG